MESETFASLCSLWVVVNVIVVHTPHYRLFDLAGLYKHGSRVVYVTVVIRVSKIFQLPNNFFVTSGDNNTTVLTATCRPVETVSVCVSQDKLKAKCNAEVVSVSG